MTSPDAESARLSESEKQRRIVRSAIPVDLRHQTLQEAIHKLHAEQGRICGACGEWPEFCPCDSEGEVDG